ncbi:biotin-independent malonate decarboxylase subunit gamma [Methylocella tundrae]|uniref:Biotin-independent malonate decarboxylase subunit gamma n=1 Tax=Methylocella tundrae TaxID=227605 RepID=A0A4U8Z299_METTU|nr:biotin-independent malonate decarboxylase subunit gamma [Methylocella tundrae]WPP03394.1 biotin-independent malonate decarboxylase subunit gamma [Methylocella tundrae]VFU09445.1 Biotin-independent malonate decarboxylase subunit gamma [Methylocella tundrae]
MTPDEILASLFPQGHDVVVDDEGLVFGSGPSENGARTEVIGIAHRAALGVDGAVKLARKVLAVIEAGHTGPLLVLVDSDSQRMSKRDEMLGLSEYLAHLSKSLILADLRGIATIGLLYGHTAAGAFIATALSTRVLVALPGADPEVMDLPSMSRVTKLSIDVLKEKAKSTPVFAPGLDNLAQTGAVLESWDPNKSLAAQLSELLQRQPTAGDHRDALGKARGGRPKAADIALRVQSLAASDV